ncbi:hypothetical protein [Pandoraea sputorum]
MNVDHAKTANTVSTLPPTQSDTPPPPTSELAGSFEKAHQAPPDDASLSQAATVEIARPRTTDASVTDFDSLMLTIPSDTQKAMRHVLELVCSCHLKYEEFSVSDSVRNTLWKEFQEAVVRCEGYWATVQHEYFPEWAMIFVIFGFANRHLGPNHKRTMNHIYERASGYAFSDAAYVGQHIPGWRG